MFIMLYGDQLKNAGRHILQPNTPPLNTNSIREQQEHSKYKIILHLLFTNCDVHTHTVSL